MNQTGAGSGTDDVDAEEARVTADANKAGELAAAILAADKKANWTAGSPRDLGGVRWAPHLTAADPDRAVHIHLSDRLPRYVIRRLRAAAAQGTCITLALPLAALYDEETLAVLAELDADTYVYDVDGEIGKRRHYLAALADLSVPVSREMRRSLARAAWDRRANGTDQQKGRRLEALLAFLLAQVAEFRIFQRNLRNATQEIDVVVQVDHYSQRCWSMPGVPFVLVEAKNWTATVGQQVVSLLIRKLQTKRGSARLGMLFAVSSISSDARTEELRLSESNLCVAMFGPAEIEAWINAEDPDQYLEDCVGRAMLR